VTFAKKLAEPFLFLVARGLDTTIDVKTDGQQGALIAQDAAGRLIGRSLAVAIVE
jgi:hypothetical protein